MADRREFLRIAIAGAVGVAAGATAGFFGGSTVSQTELRRLQDEISQLRVTRPRLESGINVFNWSEYFHDNLITVFEQNSGVRVSYDTYESNEELLAKLLGGGTSLYDVVIPTDFVIPEMIEKNLLRPLDRSKLPNIKHLDPKFINPAYDQGNKFTVPYLWGTTGIGWNKSKITEGVTGWETLFDPNFVRKYERKVTLLVENVDVIGAVNKFLGRSFNDLDHLDEVKQTVLRVKPLLAQFADATTYIPNLANETFLISHAWSGDVFVVIDENPNVVYTIPKQGAHLWVDNLVIPRDAPHPEAAHAWINYVLEPSTAAILTNTRFYANPNRSASPFVDEDVISDPAIYPPSEVFAKLEIQKPLTAQEKERVSAVWTEIIA